MKILLLNGTNPYENLALEEIILKDANIKEDVLMFYINSKCVIIGRNQNIWEEINLDFVKKHNIKLVRRISGGGAVYQDQNNICFSFITSTSKSYHDFLEPIIEYFKSLNLNAEFHGKNDVHINGFKVSGNAQYKYKNRMFHHGTILYKTDMNNLVKSLKPNNLKIQSKGIKSIRQRVSNIYDLLETKTTTNDFLNNLIDFLKRKYDATHFDIANYNNKNNKLIDLIQMHSSNKWIYNKNPQFQVTNHKRFFGGTIKLLFSTKKNMIIKINFFGDFLSKINFEEIYSLFLNKEYSKESISNIINKINNFEDYFGKITKKEVISLFF